MRVYADKRSRKVKPAPAAERAARDGLRTIAKGEHQAAKPPEGGDDEALGQELSQV